MICLIKAKKPQDRRIALLTRCEPPGPSSTTRGRNRRKNTAGVRGGGGGGGGSHPPRIFRGGGQARPAQRRERAPPALSPPPGRVRPSGARTRARPQTRGRDRTGLRQILAPVILVAPWRRRRARHREFENRRPSVPAADTSDRPPAIPRAPPPAPDRTNKAARCPSGAIPPKNPAPRPPPRGRLARRRQPPSPAHGPPRPPIRPRPPVPAHQKKREGGGECPSPRNDGGGAGEGGRLDLNRVGGAVAAAESDLDGASIFALRLRC